MFVDFNILNQLGSPSINSNTFANRPAAGQTGRLFVSTDTFEIYRDNGTGWDLIGGPGAGTITGTGTATQVAYFTGAQTIGSSANLFWDNTAGALGINTATPGAELDVHGTGIIAQLNSTSATANSLLAFQRSGSGVWRIGDQYNGGSNFFELHNTVLTNNAIEVTAANNKSTFTALETYASGLATGNQFTYNLTVPNGVNITSPNAVGAVNSYLNLSLGGNTTVPSGARQGLEGNSRISFTGAGTLTMTQGSTVRAFSALSSVYSFAGSAVGTVTHLAGLRICFPDNIGSAINITNNYGLLLNDQTTGSGTVTYTNRWGIYQEGASDLNYFNGNLLVGSTTNSGQRLQVTGTALFTGSVTGTGISSTYTVTAASGVARSKSITSTLVAAANNDELVALDINPSFTVGSFTGLRNFGLRVQNSKVNFSGTYSGNANEGLNPQTFFTINTTFNSVSTSGTRYVHINPTINLNVPGTQIAAALYISPTFQNVGTASTYSIYSQGNNYFGQSGGSTTFEGSNTNFIGQGGAATNLNATAPNNQGFRINVNTNAANFRTEIDGAGLADFRFLTAGNDRVRIFNNGNVFIGASPTDAGYRLDVAGTFRRVVSGAEFRIDVDSGSNRLFSNGLIRYQSNGSSQHIFINQSGTVLTGYLMALSTTGAAAGARALEISLQDNNSAIIVSGASLTGANAQNLIDISQTWNTTGNPTALKLNVTNTASGATSYLMDLQVGGATQFRVTPAGSIRTAAPTTGTAANWKLGSRVAAAVALDATQYIELEVGGTLYKLAIVI